MKKIKEGEPFEINGKAMVYSVKDGRVVLSYYSGGKQKPKAVAPTEQEVKEYASSKGYDGAFMWEKMSGYIENGMKDSHDNVIKNWRLKLNQVWFKPENKIKEAAIRPQKKQI